MNEENTFKALKGLTQAEAEEMFKSIYAKIAEEEGQSTITGPQPISIPKLKERVDKEMAPYGWSFKKIMNFDNLDFS